MMVCLLPGINFLEFCDFCLLNKYINKLNIQQVSTEDFMSIDVKQIGERVEKESPVIHQIRTEMHKVIAGQDALIDGLILALLCSNHVLIEGVPGLAKTLSITTLSKMIQASFQRLQFTPDMLPADVIGTLIYNPKTGEFTTKKGPIFANIILADEINRAPAKVQSALLEAMQERQVTIGDDSYPLDDPFLVMATQNPIEQEGTYPLTGSSGGQVHV